MILRVWGDGMLKMMKPELWSVNWKLFLENFFRKLFFERRDFENNDSFVRKKCKSLKCESNTLENSYVTHKLRLTLLNYSIGALFGFGSFFINVAITEDFKRRAADHSLRKVWNELPITIFIPSLTMILVETFHICHVRVMTAHVPKLSREGSSQSQSASSLFELD